MGKVPVSRGGKKKGGSVRKSQSRPCWTCKTVEGSQVCHEHGGKWLRTAGKTAAGTSREVYSCGAAGCTSEVSKCQHCGLLHSGRDDRDYLAILNKCRRTIQPLPPLCPCDRCRGKVGCRGVRVVCGVRLLLGHLHLIPPLTLPSPPPSFTTRLWSGTTRAPPTDRSTRCEMSAMHIWYPRRTSSSQIRRRVCQHHHSERASLYLRRPFMPRPCRRRVYQLALLWFARSDEAERVRQRREEMRRGLPTVERWGGLASWREGVPARDQASSADAVPGDVGKKA